MCNEEIEKQCYSTDCITPAKETFDIYKKCPEQFIVLRHNKEVIAFLLMLSFKKDTYMKIKNGEMNEVDQRDTDIETGKDAFNYSYFSVIAIHKYFRTAQNLMLLINKFKNHVKAMVNKGVKFIEIMADCVTPEGHKMARKFLKMEPVLNTEHGSTIYCADGKKFVSQFYEHEF